MALQELKYVPLEILDRYLLLLRRRPALTKSVTSGAIAGLGDVFYQVIKSEKIKDTRIDWQSVCAYAGSGLLITGPLAHYFYLFLDKVIPAGSRWASIKRIIVERVLFGPIYLMLVIYVRSRFKGMTHYDAKKKMYRTYWPILKMSYRVWTIAQYININHVPQQHRVLFLNLVSLGWNVYLASQEAQKK